MSFTHKEVFPKSGWEQQNATPNKEDVMRHIPIGVIAILALAFMVVTQSSLPANAVGENSLAPRLHRYIDWGNPEKPVWVVVWTTRDGADIFNVWGPATRRTSGVGGTILFSSGERVAGFRIILDTGQVFSQCWVDTWAGGSVTDGVVNPFPGEMPPPCR